MMNFDNFCAENDEFRQRKRALHSLAHPEPLAARVHFYTENEEKRRFWRWKMIEIKILTIEFETFSLKQCWFFENMLVFWGE